MIQEQSFPINFAKGLDTKTDPKQIQVGNFLSLQNSIFDNGGLLQKRNGYKSLVSLPNDSFSYLTTLNGNLTAIGDSISALNASTSQWVNRGSIAPMKESVQPIIRNNFNQSQCDSVVSDNGLVCTVYTESTGSITSYKYVVSSYATGQNILTPAVIPVSSGTVTGSPRVFLLGSYFIIVFTNDITSTYHLQYVAISTLNPGTPTANTDIISAYIPASTVAWDGVVAGEKLFVAANSTTGGQSIKVRYLQSNLQLSTTVSFTGSTDIATAISLSADIANTSAPIIYINFYDSSTMNGYTIAVDQYLNTVLAKTQTISSTAIVNIASFAANGLVTIFFDIDVAYGYGPGLPTWHVDAVTCTQSGTVGSPYVVARSIGLGSKIFEVNGTMYFLGAYGSQYQSSYFLINASLSTESAPIVVAKLAYENGGGFLSTGLPSVTVQDSTAIVSYLYADLVEALSTNQNPQQTTSGGIYIQTGINLASFDIESTTGIITAEIGQNLHISGGFLWQYDGYLPVEHNFFLWPDNVFATIQSNPTTTGTLSNGSAIITSVASVAGIGVGMLIGGTAIPADTYVVSVGTNTITMSNTATSNESSESITFSGNQANQQYYYQVVYEWPDNQGNTYYSAPSVPVTVTTSSGNNSVVVSVPTLRLTYKIANPIKITIYRWSEANQIYYQVTSITQPILNDTTIDNITFIDSQSDAQIIGNNIIYTTGGVVEDVNAPATNIMTLFDDRLWLVDAEDPNLLWYSKQVIEATPVEMSDLFTLYIAPTIASQGSTGPVTALAPMDDKLIIFKGDPDFGNAIYYINGTGPDNTGANSQYSQPIFITSTIGCNNPNSIIFMPQGLMFQTDKGIWLLGRDLSTQYIGAPVQAFTLNATVQSAVSVPGTNQVRFTLDSGITLMYDYYYGQWGTFVNVPAISSTVYESLHTYINQYGAVYQENPGSYLDGSNPVLLSFVTGWINPQGISGYQRLYELQLEASYISPHLLNVQIGYDFGPLSEQAIIAPTNYTPVYGGDSLYGMTSPLGGPGSEEPWRIQPAQQICRSFQLSINELYDPSYGQPAGAGFTLSAVTCTLGLIRGYRPVKAANTVGTM
jgi:hypothetical protein